MAVPDLTEYLDLAFYDKDPQDIFDSGVLALRSKLPGWVPREGNIEVLLLEAMGIQVAEAVFAANRVPAAVLMALLGMAGVTPDVGQQPSAQLRFTVSTPLGSEVPAGTSVLLTLPGGLQPVVFTTAETLTVAAGSTTGVVTGFGDRYTDEANAVAAGTNLEVLDSLTNVDSVELAATITDGRDPETDEQWIDRGVQRLYRLSETLVLPRHFELAANEYPGVVRARALDNFNPAAGSGGPGSHPGFETVAVYGDRASVPEAAKTALQAQLEAAAATNLAVRVIDATINDVDVTATVIAEAGQVAAEVKANVEAALRAYLDPAEWDWSTTVRRNALFAVIGNAEGVAYVDTMTVPNADLALTGRAPLARARTLTITVTTQ